MVCAKLPPVVYHAFSFKLKKVKFSETLFKLFNLKVTVFVTVEIFDGPPNKVPIICILVDQLGQEFPVDLNKSLYFVVQNLIVLRLLQLDQLVYSSSFLLHSLSN